MEAIILPKAQFEALVGTLKQIQTDLVKKKKSNRNFIDNVEFCQLMQITDRTARTWRSKNLIPYSKLGKKIYYKLEHIEDLLTKRYISK